MSNTCGGFDRGKMGPEPGKPLSSAPGSRAIVPPEWNTQQAVDLYGLERWGEGYFRIDEEGRVVVSPQREAGKGAPLTAILTQLAQRDIHPPVSLRFPQILSDRISLLHESFLSSMRECGYKGSLRLVYPMKVNQRKQTVEELVEAGRAWNYGLEVGSKPELLCALAMETPKQSLLVVNGFKDEEYVELAASGVELGKNVVIVLDKLDEAKLVAKVLKEYDSPPMIGIRLKLNAKGGGKWAEATGEQAKFGLTMPELLQAVKTLKEADLLDRVRMVHFHIGSQVTDIKRIHQGLTEGARIYCKLRKRGVPVELVNVGGGLGVDYDGSGTTSPSSMNYDIREYTNSVAYTLQGVADEEGVPHPTIVSESGRAVVAYHGLFVTEIIKRVPDELPLEDHLPSEGDHRNLFELKATLDRVALHNYQEAYHDAMGLRESAMQRFNLGVLSLEERAKAEVLFRHTAFRVLACAQQDDNMTEEFLALQKILQHKFIANFSVFQSTPDVWGVKQLFPVVPLVRHTEQPTEFGTIVDITCDSDGEINRFIDEEETKSTLELHPLVNGPYPVGVFLTGAYQDTLGDFHNLFGRVHEAYVNVDKDGSVGLDKVVEGDSVEEVLWFANWELGELHEHMKGHLARKVEKGELTSERAEEISDGFRVALRGYTYLER
jgi:arginine decarboxylase